MLKATEAASSARIEALDRILRDWLADESTFLIAGRWGEGVVAEILPRGKARLSAAGYSGAFAGLRDLRIEGEAHHLHLDLARFTGVRYTIRPSVCYGWRPSLEIDLVGPEDTPCFSLSAGTTYCAGAFQPAPARAYFARLFEHRRRYGALVGVHVRPSSAPVQEVAADWGAILECTSELAAARGFDALDPIGSLQSVLAAALAEVDGGR